MFPRVHGFAECIPTVPRGTGAYRPRFPDHGTLCRGSWGWAAQEALINCEILTGEATEPYLVQAIARICESPHGIYSYCRSEFGRIRIGASADCRKRNRSEIVLQSQPKAGDVTRSQKLGFATLSTFPDWAHSVNDPTCLKSVRTSYPSLSGCTSTQSAAFLH